MSAAGLLNDDSTSHSTGPNISSQSEEQIRVREPVGPIRRGRAASQRQETAPMLSIVAPSTAGDATTRKTQLHQRQHQQRDGEHQRGCRGASPYWWIASAKAVW